MNINEITYKDRSEFLRGFSVIIRKNNYSNTALPAAQADEKIMFSLIGKSLGFEKEFCNKSLESIVTNKNISEEPAIFVDKRFAELFIEDVTKVMIQTNSMSANAIEWLKQTAEVNEVDFHL